MTALLNELQHELRGWRRARETAESGNIRRESAVPIEERNLTPELVEQRAGADSERQRTILPEAQIDRLRRMHQLDGDDPVEVLHDASQAACRGYRVGCCVLDVAGERHQVR